jgi:hypothetical protein
MTMHWLDDRPALAQAARASRMMGLAWRASMDAVMAAAFRADPADAEAVADEAAALFADADWLALLIAPLTAALHADPRAEPPLRLHRDGLRTGVVLHEGVGVRITASIVAGDALARAPLPVTVVAGGRLQVVRYHRAAGARLERWRAGPVAADFSAATAAACVREEDRRLEDGAVVRLDGRTHAHLLASDGGGSDVAMLTATIQAAPAAVMREYRVADGALVKAASLDEGTSRMQMLLTLLRLTGASGAAPAFAAATHEADFATRWSAMREWLALDVAGALPRLRELVDDPHPEVRAAARATLPLAEAHPCRG